MNCLNIGINLLLVWSYYSITSSLPWCNTSIVILISSKAQLLFKNSLVFYKKTNLSVTGINLHQQKEFQDFCIPEQVFAWTLLPPFNSKTSLQNYWKIVIMLSSFVKLYTNSCRILCLLHINILLWKFSLSHRFPEDIISEF